jgi:hypothetical protein
MRIDTPNSLNQPAETAGTPDGHNTPVARLAALAMHLGTRGLDIDATQEGVIARDPDRPDTTLPITCQARPDDAQRMWFFAADTPIAEADRMVEAAVTIRSLFTPDDTEGER